MMKDAIRRNLPRFLLLIAFMAVGLGVGAYIVAHQRLRFPLIEEAPITLKAELPTAQAVTPGQGQTVRVSGVQIGEIGEVELEDGRAVVELKIEPEYEGLVTDRATALLRPKTSLKDMFLELDPGRGRPLEEGETLSVSQAIEDVHPDRILQMLDADTRDYLRLLVAGAGLGLKDRGPDLREIFRLFEPTHRDIARVNTAVSTRRASLRRLVRSLRLLSGELAGREDELAQLVSSASRVFRAYASEDENISAAVRELPTALRQTTDTLGEVERLAEVLGPASERLRPVARALGRSQVALRPLAREATPLLAERIRPLVREARPVVRQLRPAAQDLAEVTPDLTRVFLVLNKFFNMAAYNPGGREGPEVDAREEGYLFWLAWIAHQSATVFSTADAHGPFRPSLVAMSCQTARTLAHDEPGAEFLLNLTPILKGPEACGE
jgi:phospholipid/cholesterol/gamma-HCH transport system substrate-binding protein